MRKINTYKKEENKEDWKQRRHQNREESNDEVPNYGLFGNSEADNMSMI